MRSDVLLLLAMITAGPAHAQVGAVTEVDGQLTVNLGVPIDKQVDYIRELSRFYFSKVRWYRKFRAYSCPEFEALVQDENVFCPLGTMPPLQPIQPFNRCDVNPSIPNCSITSGSGPDGKPSCKEVPELCSPPLYCDWEANRGKTECLTPPDCAANPTNVLCRVFTKCDLSTWAGSQACLDKRTCSTNDTLVCLDVCDTNPELFKNECIVEKCQLFPNDPICPQVYKCMPTKICDGMDAILKPECCAGAFCIYDCRLRGDCPTPPQVCQWGYNVGQAVIKFFQEPVVNQQMSSTNALEFIECYTTVTQNVDTRLEMKCFDGGVADGFLVMDQAAKDMMLKMISSAGSATVVVNDTNRIVYDLQTNTTQKITA